MSHLKGYGQFCPVARAAEVLTERWVPLIIRELLCGSVRFSELQRGVPRMSSALLSQRLKELEFSGIVERRPDPSRRGAEYHLTKAGRELYPLVVGMGTWAQRWLRNDLTAAQNLDPDLLMWDIRRRVTAESTGHGERFVVQFEFSGVPVSRRRYWLVFDRGEIDLCVKDPGFEPDLYLYSHVRTMTEVWLGHASIDESARKGNLRIEGPPSAARRFRDALAFSVFAESGREPPGR